MKNKSNKYVLYLQEIRGCAGDFEILCRDVFVSHKTTREIRDLFLPGSKISVVDPNGGVLIANYLVSNTRYRTIGDSKEEFEVSIVDPRATI